MRSRALESLLADLELAGDETLSARFTPSFDPECAVVLARHGAGWAGWWVCSARPVGGQPLPWLDPLTSREPLLAEAAVRAAVATAIRTATLAQPAGPRSIVLDGCGFALTWRASTRVTRDGHLAQPGEEEARRLARGLCERADTSATWDATRAAFGALRGYCG